MASPPGLSIWESCIRPLAISMTMCGMNLNIRKGVNNWSRCIVSTGSSIMLATYCLTSNIRTLKLAWSDGHVISSTPLVISTIFRVLCSLSVIVIFALRRHRISAIFWKLHRCLHIVPGARVRAHIWRIKIQVIIGCVVCWVSILFFIYINILRNTEEPVTSKYGYTMQYEESFNKSLHWWKAAFVHVFDVALLIASTVGPMSFFSLAFILFCTTLATIVDDFNAWMCESSGEIKSVVRLKTFRSVRKALARLVAEADAAFSPITFFIFAIQLCDIYKYTYFLVSNRDLCLMAFMYMTPVMTRMLYVSLLFLLLSLSAVIVTDKLDETLPILNRLANEVEEGKSNTHNMAFADSLKSAPARLTAWKLFPINKKFLICILASVIAYIMILISATPEIIRLSAQDMPDRPITEL